MLKYNSGIDFYEREDYGKALRLFESLKASFRGTNKDELVSYYIAKCTFYEKDYQLGSYYFSKFAKDFPNSKHNEEALFMTAYCEYLESPKFSLDQTTTLEAIKKLQIFIDQYPNSTRIARCNELLDSLRDKLEKKAYENALLYYKIGSNSFGAFQASIVSFQNVLVDYPDTERKEDILFKILKARYEIANKSIEKKKKERFKLVVSDYNNLKKEFPTSDLLKDAENIYQKSLKQIN
jgi:outer membrane protein assembly factor BamD